MGTCKCGPKTIKFTPGKVKPAAVKAAPKPAKNPSPRSKRLSAQATKKANRQAAPCNCTP